MDESPANNALGHFIVSLAAIVIFLANISYSGVWHPDAPSHALNGVFYRDMVQEAGFLHPMAYAERYYVQYPNLTIGTYPPVFYIVEALFFGLFGVSPLIAKLAVMLFTLLGINVFFLLCRLWFPVSLSIVGCLLYLLQPAILFGQTNVMLEMPALAMSLVALYCLYVSTERDNAYALFLTPVFMALAFLTKQSSIFLIPIWIGWLIHDKSWHVYKSQQFMVGMFIATVMLIPWIVISLTTSKFYVVGAVFKGVHLKANLLSYFGHPSEIMSYPVILLSLLSVALFIKLRKEHGYKFSLLWAGSALCCILLYDNRMVSAEPRQGIFLVPALIVLCLYAINFARNRHVSFLRHRSVYPILMIVLVGMHVSPTKLWGARDIQGFDEVAGTFVGDQDCVSVLYDGYFNSNFVFHMRARDRDRRVFVFRASKLVFSTKWLSGLGYYELISDRPAFLQTLDRYSIKYIIQEERNLMKTSANKKLRQWVQEPDFRLVREYPMRYQRFQGFGRLLVYEYLKHEAKAIQEVVLDMPVLGRKIRVNLKGET